MLYRNLALASLAAAIGLIGVTGAASAADICAPQPKSQWLGQAAIGEKAKELGYDVKSVQEEDGCWEVKGFDKAGKRVEVYFDPVSATVVKTKG